MDKQRILKTKLLRNRCVNDGFIVNSTNLSSTDNIVAAGRVVEFTANSLGEITEYNKLTTEEVVDAHLENFLLTLNPSRKCLEENCAAQFKLNVPADSKHYSRSISPTSEMRIETEVRNMYRFSSAMLDINGKPWYLLKDTDWEFDIGILCHAFIYTNTAQANFLFEVQLFPVVDCVKRNDPYYMDMIDDVIEAFDIDVIGTATIFNKFED